ncbi:DNA mismatch repair endonuclease MutL [Natronosalvus halobius]|uniref:DNA mismatch repair endonuclease MutL n=1 Tax=Natronosalvus halobius TaxID=2953746 RepID=UPI00209F1DED|nr:DNA mismatch repair endonuclease MutL [Natronosalvus halobius]USZ71684.1 DNA mismatch repair endonuclease MutL [Natronosalvus halobius]
MTDDTIDTPSDDPTDDADDRANSRATDERAADETTIHQLDEHTVARIAAGEVVERPASAVKELVENALDADATRIDVEIEAGGTEFIRVSDDGRGMTETDVRRAVRQHTTSKITGLEDLERGVESLGFRGEALHTIGSVSKLTIRTRPRADGLSSESPTGTELVYEGGDVVAVEPTGCPEGTTVVVEDLFYNTPARRKFLKTTATEFAHVNQIVTRYALANPDVALSLTHDGREVFATTGQDDLQAAILSVYGREVARSMIDVEADGDDLPIGPLESVSGTVSHPETNRASRDYLATYVNGRAVTSEAIREGIMNAYGGQLGGDRYPFVVLFLEVPGDAVDVNVHPRKREVRFDDDDAVRRAVESAVQDALLEYGLLRSRAPRGRSAPDEAAVEPDAGYEDGTLAGAADEPEAGGSSGSGPSNQSVSGDAVGSRSLDSNADSSEAPATQADGSKTTESPEAEGSLDATRTNASGRADTASSTPSSDLEASRSDPSIASEPTNRTASTTDSSDATDVTGATDAGDRSRHAASGDPSHSITPSTDQQTLAGGTATDALEYDSLPSLRVLGQLKDTYVVCETPEGLVLVDQHAADERVNYERLQRAFADDPTTQALASPVELELTAVEAEAFEHYRDALARLGFSANRIDDRTVAVTTVPAVLEKTLEPAQLRDVLGSFLDGDREAGAETIDALADDFLADLACYPSITGNTSLSEGSVLDLLEALDDCENPYACPHGRPVLVQFEYDDLEDRFERDYPGHA